MDVSARLQRWVRAHCAVDDADVVLDALANLTPAMVGGQDVERVQAALVFAAAGDAERFQYALSVARMDWRDALVGGGLGDADWLQRLAAKLGQDD